MCEPIHKQIRLVHPEYDDIDVDAGIADLIQLIWDHDIFTILSCEDNQDSVWLCFPHAMELEKFLRIVVGDRRDDLYRRVTNQYPADYHWGYDICVEDTNEDTNDQPDVTFTASVRFRESDLGIVKERLAEWGF